MPNPIFLEVQGVNKLWNHSIVMEVEQESLSELCAEFLLKSLPDMVPEPNGFKTNNRTESLFVVQAKSLSAALGNDACLVSFYSSVGVDLSFENPFTTDNLVIRW